MVGEESEPLRLLFLFSNFCAEAPGKMAFSARARICVAACNKRKEAGTRTRTRKHCKAFPSTRGKWFQLAGIYQRAYGFLQCRWRLAVYGM